MTITPDWIYKAEAMNKIEITIADNLHRKLEIASKSSDKSIEQLVLDLLIQAYGDMEFYPDTSEALLAESYQVRAEGNTNIVADALAAQVVACEKKVRYTVSH
jgi:hypothetical protein